ncbi:MAG TPA: crossover junction endodeoxyribonuclease RuvC [Patescibacteria group bacterium]|nr:crossover junction endodeoxyribonuclease RuvC [Patescibacteria group bacterium]
MRILGIDPGIGRTGWGIITNEKGKMVVGKYGCVETPSTMPMEKRLQVLYEEISRIITEEKPNALGIEDLFFNTNAKTALVVGQARGVILLLASQHNLSLGVYTPLQVKIAVTGYGRAEKGQVGQMVKTILKLPSIPKPDDTADALAIAITHAFSYKTPKK